MSIISQNSENEVAVIDCVQRFFSSHKIGSLLKSVTERKRKVFRLFLFSATS